jgi:hypothetical protein
VVQISASKIAFAVISNNSATNKSSRLIGIAARSPDTDPEISEDALGNSYPSLDFYYEDNCFLHINIELAHHDNATISESKCSDKRDGTTPFATDSSLHRIRRP